MTKQLETLLNLPENKRLIKRSEKTLEESKAPAPAPALLRDIGEFDKISSALPKVTGLGDKTDDELDQLAKRATEAYDDLMSLGMNVEPRYSSRLFEVASSMLKNAIDAKSTKIDKKLKMIELQLKKQALDQKSQPDSESSVEVQGTGVIVTDRNSLIEKLKTMNK